MLASIDALKKPIASSHQRHRDMLAKHLAEPARDALIALFNNPTEGIARSAHHGAAIRNAVMLEILYETGMRVGELLSLKLKDFTPARGGDHATLVIRRNHDDPFDRRLRRPVAKTLGRHIGITEHLSRRIQLLPERHEPTFRTSSLLMRASYSSIIAAQLTKAKRSK